MTKKLQNKCFKVATGNVVPCNEEEAVSITEYILKFAGKEDTADAREIINSITKGGECKIKYINGSWNVFNFITYVLESSDYNLPCDLTIEPIFCYVYNMEVPEYSEFTECRFRRKGRGLVRRFHDECSLEDFLRIWVESLL